MVYHWCILRIYSTYVNRERARQLIPMNSSRQNVYPKQLLNSVLPEQNGRQATLQSRDCWRIRMSGALTRDCGWSGTSCPRVCDTGSYTLGLYWPNGLEVEGKPQRTLRVPTPARPPHPPPHLSTANPSTAVAQSKFTKIQP